MIASMDFAEKSTVCCDHVLYFEQWQHNEITQISILLKRTLY